jgi:hypothetical protein
MASTPAESKLSSTGGARCQRIPSGKLHAGKVAMALITAFDLRRNIDAFTLELENHDLVADAEKNFVVIIKAGKTYKNTLG